MPDDILQKLPPIVVWTAEFDHLRRDNEHFAKRAKSVGRLAGLSITPGSFHGFNIVFYTSPDNKNFYDEEKKAFNFLINS